MYMKGKGGRHEDEDNRESDDDKQEVLSVKIHERNIQEDAGGGRRTDSRAKNRMRRMRMREKKMMLMMYL